MLDPRRLSGVWHRVTGSPCPEELFESLLRAYAQPHRAYHTADHILDCLRQLDDVWPAVGRPEEVELALWFHDAVYDTRRSDNEEQSATWAVMALTKGGASTGAAFRIGQLVLLTKHQADPEDGDGEVLVDVDLSILGRPPEVFDEYDRRIRLEYQWVPEAQYREERAAIIDRFLARRFLYRTGHFRDRYEAMARENLGRAVRRLREGTTS